MTSSQSSTKQLLKESGIVNKLLTIVLLQFQVTKLNLDNLEFFVEKKVRVHAPIVYSIRIVYPGYKPLILFVSNKGSLGASQYRLTKEQLQLIMKIAKPAL